MYAKLEMLIDGAWTQGSGKRREKVLNPSNEQVLGELPVAERADLDAALAAADAAQAAWAATLPKERGRILRKAADLMRERADEIARQMTMEQGKPLAESKMEAGAGADILEWYAEEGRRAYGRVIAPSVPTVLRAMMVKEPVGPVAAFTPWNFPVVTPVRKIGGALAAGCTLIIKPSEETPAGTIAIAQALQDAGLPKGVLNVVFGVPAEISEYLIASDIIKKISFTGSIPVGKHLTRLAAEGMKRVTMELGGHGPVIVFDDVDVEKVAAMSVAGKFRNAGQVCVSPTRFIVQNKLYGDFVDAFTAKAKALKVGDGLENGVQMGPLANARRLDAIDSLIRDAVESGAKLKTGGERIGNNGYFYAPTVLSDVPKDSRIMNEEPFGPVAPITRFESFDEAVHEANRLPFGLAGYAFTNSAETSAKIGAAMKTGLVGLNSFVIAMPETPFGGVKESGYGSEGGIEGLDAYLSTKLVTQSGAV
jgi:succinate-semialdehyde dehydrogenase/glutarate-semialdehyde dehydrogenase